MNMIGTLTTSTSGISLRLPPPNSIRSTSKTFSGKTSFQAVLDTKPVVDRTARIQASLYEVLRVERNATPIEIKTAYRNLAKVYHPDASDFKQHGDRDFIEIHDAYATLSDPEARASYDRKWTNRFGPISGLYTDAGQRQGFYSTRRWETDQCW